MAEQAFCIHAHFYQPPREDSILGKIPSEPGAYPFNNWNERIHDRCYQPNAALGNFEHISFDIGPTLINWMEDYDPTVKAAIIAQEFANVRHYGVGNGMAHAYHHTILPLASFSDKLTQITWGITDFEYYFGHKPTGMWLPETAVDYETLEALVECGIEFTILAPWQAEASQLDITRPYWVDLPSGRRIAVFFYHSELSAQISFDPGSTVNADQFLFNSVLPGLNSFGEDGDRFLIIASDGELYGHHQPFREKFLAYLYDDAVKNQGLKTSFPGLWLRSHPPKEIINIKSKTSWSCFHRLNRWKGECGCTQHGEWKAPLRNGLEKIAKEVDTHYLRVLSPLMENPWELRHQYIHVLHKNLSVEELIRSKIHQPLDKDMIRKIDLLLKAQYERQRMFTSCGWFFEDFDRIEPCNNVSYAAQAVWLTSLATGINLNQISMTWLSDVKSWRSGLRADAVFYRHLQRANQIR